MGAKKHQPQYDDLKSGEKKKKKKKTKKKESKRQRREHTGF